MEVLLIGLLVVNCVWLEIVDRLFVDMDDIGKFDIGVWIFCLRFDLGIGWGWGLYIGILVFLDFVIVEDIWLFCERLLFLRDLLLWSWFFILDFLLIGCLVLLFKIVEVECIL